MKRDKHWPSYHRTPSGKVVSALSLLMIGQSKREVAFLHRVNPATIDRWLEDASDDYMYAMERERTWLPEAHFRRQLDHSILGSELERFWGFAIVLDWWSNAFPGFERLDDRVPDKAQLLNPHLWGLEDESSIKTFKHRLELVFCYRDRTRALRHLPSFSIRFPCRYARGRATING